MADTQLPAPLVPQLPTLPEQLPAEKPAPPDLAGEAKVYDILGTTSMGLLATLVSSLLKSGGNLTISDAIIGMLAMLAWTTLAIVYRSREHQRQRDHWRQREEALSGMHKKWEATYIDLQAWEAGVRNTVNQVLKMKEEAVAGKEKIEQQLKQSRESFFRGAGISIERPEFVVADTGARMTITLANFGVTGGHVVRGVLTSFSVDEKLYPGVVHVIVAQSNFSFSNKIDVIANEVVMNEMWQHVANKKISRVRCVLHLVFVEEGDPKVKDILLADEFNIRLEVAPTVRLEP